MVSKASEDLPEPESPVNTTSLSRGISTSMFFRLCSRAPRMVMARWLCEACWRRAFRTSSISAFPGASTRKHQGALRRKLRIRRQWVRSEHRKNGGRFPVLTRSHQQMHRAVAAAVSRGFKQKGRHEAGLLVSDISRSQYFEITG